MTKNLLIVRHAKSDWNVGIDQDFFRSLAPKGVERAVSTFTDLKNKISKPEIIITSPAIRAYSTAVIFNTVFQMDASKIELAPDFYECGVNSILERIKKTDDKVNRIAIFGHNYDFTFLLNQLLGKDIGTLKTCGYAYLQFEIDSWADILKKQAELLCVDMIE
jgi:phosphohistidine phosphatase